MDINGFNVSIFIIIMVLCSFSVFCSQVFKKKFEEITPITIMGIVFILYLFGLFDFLKTGVYVVLLIALFLYLYVLYNLIIKKNWIELFQNTFTPGFLIFIFFYVVLVLIHRGRLLLSWDEFTFWGYSVKAMYGINDFVTNPASGVQFKSYPPAMSLFQYFFQVLAGSFTEGLLFVSYQIFAVSLFLPFLKNLKWNELLKIFIIIAIIIISPTFCFTIYYTLIIIDPILGLVFGFGLATVLVNKEYDVLASANLFLTIFVLILLKPAGSFLAAIILFIVLTDVFFIKKSLVEIIKNKNLKENLKKVFVVIFLLSAFLFAKYSWIYEMNSNKVDVVFSQPIAITELINILAGNDTTYKSQVVDNFLVKVHQQAVNPVFQPLTFFSAFGLFIILFFYFYKKDENKKRTKLILITVLLGDLIYLFGLLVLYLFRFSPHEAINLASFNRYLDIYVFGVLILIVLKIISDSCKESGVKFALIGLLAFLLIYVESVSILKLFYKSTELSIKTRQPYTDAAKKFTDLVGTENHKVWIITQNDSGLLYWILRFSLRHNITFNEGFSWSIGSPYGEKDLWTKKINADRWMDELVMGYDYVFIYTCDEQFIKEFGKLFTRWNVPLKDIIKNRSVYKVNKKDRCLDIVG